jgi:hypothetical protein
MPPRTAEFIVTELQWLKLHLRLAAREQSGSRLSYRFEFFPESEVDVTCGIYYIDDDLNPMKQVSDEERIEIYEGRIALGMDIIRRALKLAELPSTFVWNPTLQFILYEECGMGGQVVHTVKTSFAWPEKSITA